MIIYGYRSKELAKEHLTEKCHHCNTQNSIDIHIFQKYAHVFWIPLFPIGKTAISQCNHCKQTLPLKEMPASFNSVYQQLKSQAKTPVWTFVGSVLFIGLISAGIISDRNKDAKNAQLVLKPEHRDVFEIKTKDNQYTLYKIAIVEGDSVYIRPNNYETNKISGIRDLKNKGDEGYAEEVFAFSKAELKDMFDKGEILDIEKALAK